MIRLLLLATKVWIFLGVFTASIDVSVAATPVYMKLQQRLATFSGNGRTVSKETLAILQYMEKQLTQTQIATRDAHLLKAQQYASLSDSIEDITSQIKALKRIFEHAREPSPTDHDGSIFSRDKIKRAKQKLTKTDMIADSEALASGYGTKNSFRTLCVRICDGYYFPISFSIQSEFFERDQNICSAKCPNTETELYYHYVKNQSSEDMVSVKTNISYRELPNAFKYRMSDTKRLANCSCRMTEQNAYFDELQNKVEESDLVQQHISASAISEAERDHSEKAEIVEKATVSDTKKSHIRVVGPKFFPDRTEVIDLPAPAQRKDL